MGVIPEKDLLQLWSITSHQKIQQTHFFPQCAEFDEIAFDKYLLQHDIQPLTPIK